MELKGDHCDIGASIGMLSSILAERDIISYGIDGSDYGIRKNKIKIPLDRYAVCDMTKIDISILDTYKMFDITTAFEITEHIPEEHIGQFYKNCQYMSNRHLCSVHWGGDDNSKFPHHNHYNVKPVNWWLEFLSDFGEAEVVDLNIPTFNESSIIKINFKK
jgi:hypothetical protein